MPRNTQWFATYLRETRERLGWTQQQVADQGGPYRQLQGTMEGNGEPELRSHILELIDRAYGWPTAYALGLAELGEYAHDSERSLPDCLNGGERDQAALGPGPRSRVYKTFSALYEEPSPERNTYRLGFVGFDVNSGEPVHLDGPVLTNVAFNILWPMILARHGVSTIDTNVTTAETRDRLSRVASDGRTAGVAQKRLRIFSVGVEGPDLGESIVFDPLKDITTLAEAKHLAANLLAVRPAVQTSAVRAGFTFLGIAASGEDPLLCLTELSRPFEGSGSIEFASRFNKFWRDSFYDPANAGPTLASPDRTACELLAGVLAARDRTMNVRLSDKKPGEQRTIQFERVKVVTPEQMSCESQGPSLIFYDSKVIPELPVVQSAMQPTEALTFHCVNYTAPRLNKLVEGRFVLGQSDMSPRFGKYPYHRIGIATDADDRDIVAEHNPYDLCTLTNYVKGTDGGQAIFCQGGRARRIWIPQR